MSNLHEAHISKVRKVAGYILSIVPSLMIVMAGLMKVSGAAEMQLNMAKIPSFVGLMFMVGLIELVALALYWIPKTSHVGFFLLASFGGGIIVAEIVSGGMPVAGIMVTTLFYIGTFLRKPTLFGMGS